MKVSDFIVEFMVQKGVADFFGYQGTMIAHLVDSIERHPIARNHSCYNEQGAAFAACGYAQAKSDCACAYATSGPGAVNLLSGVANAYYDSQPVVFFTGQLNTYEYLHIPGLRQSGFQEIDIVAMAKPVTKYCVQVTRAEDIVKELNRAYHIATTGRKGPVLIDLPMDIQRGEVTDPQYTWQGEECPAGPVYDCVEQMLAALREAKRPAILLGNGVDDEESQKILRQFAERFRIPILTSVLAKSALAVDDPLNFGCLGCAYGHRYANMIANVKSDLLLCFGISLATRQVGVKTEKFARGATIMRVDIDGANLQRNIHPAGEKEYKFQADAKAVIHRLWEEAHRLDTAFDGWLSVCDEIKRRLEAVDEQVPERQVNKIVERLSDALDATAAVGVDVGQHMVWCYHSFKNREGQKLLFSGAHGAMGYALPAAIGAYYATGKPVACICGDGSMQMNIQELQWVVREQIPIKMIVLNNGTLGLIRQQQIDMLGGLFAGSTAAGGFTSCAFHKVAAAYGIEATCVSGEDVLAKGVSLADPHTPELWEILLDEATFAYPKTYFGEEIHNQRPYIPAAEYEEILAL